MPAIMAGDSIARRSIQDAKGERMASTRSEGEKTSWLFEFLYMGLSVYVG
jgi:hypothetical protein